MSLEIIHHDQATVRVRVEAHVDRGPALPQTLMFFSDGPSRACIGRAAKFHPLEPELTLVHAGRLALGMSADRPQAWGL